MHQKYHTFTCLYIKNTISKIGISAHDLEVEQGWYNKTLREERTCKWCDILMVSEIIEDENNFLHDCDLYNDLCTKLMTNLKK